MVIGFLQQSQPNGIIDSGVNGPGLAAVLSAIGNYEIRAGYGSILERKARYLKCNIVKGFELDFSSGYCYRLTRFGCHHCHGILTSSSFHITSFRHQAASNDAVIYQLVDLFKYWCFDRCLLSYC
jgi:hypothetical protein